MEGMQIRWRVLVGGYWLAGWLVGWLVLGGMVAGCSPDPAVNSTRETDGPALIVFYTDN
jgi:hypothetical protein